MNRLDSPSDRKPEEWESVWLMVEGLDALEEPSAQTEGSAGETATTVTSGCDWCGEWAHPGYFVAFGSDRYAVCAICWGRSPDYVAFRREGLAHDAILRKLSPG
jgi:hypothetical protein